MATAKKATKRKVAPKKKAVKKAAPKKSNTLIFGNGVRLKKSTYHANDERYIIMDGSKKHLDGQPFFLETATLIAAALSRVKSNRKKWMKP